MTKKILLADDDPKLRRLVAATLGGAYKFLEAADGEQALEMARRENPDLILLDIIMPGLDGLEVLGRLKADQGTSQIKVVMLTGLGIEEFRSAGENAGADGYFVKPFSPRALLEMVTDLLD